MRRTREEAEQTRRAIMNAALAKFSTHGYQAARLQDIAEAAGVTRGAIYHHFEGKPGLYSTLMEEVSSQESEVIEEAIVEGGSLIEIMRRILTNSLAQLEENQRLRQAFVLSFNQVVADPDLNNVHRQRIDSSQQLIRSMASLMAQGIIMGELREGLDPTTVARAFIAYQNGIASMWLDDRQVFSLKEKAAEFAEIFTAGLEA